MTAPIRRFHLTLAFAALTVVASFAYAHSYRIAEIEIGHPWARPTVSGQQAGGAFLSLQNRGSSADRLIGASSPAADAVELHTMSLEGNVMRMRQVDAIDVPPGQSVKLQPGGMHLMFQGLKAPMKLGDRIPVTLRFERAGEVAVEVKVENPSNRAKEPKTPDEHKHHH